MLAVALVAGVPLVTGSRRSPEPSATRSSGFALLRCSIASARGRGRLACVAVRPAACAAPCCERSRSATSGPSRRSSSSWTSPGSMPPRPDPRPRRASPALGMSCTLRTSVADVPSGLTGFTDRVLPYLFPTGDDRAFAQTLERSVRAEAPPPQQANLVATTFEALPALGRDGFFSPGAKFRTRVLVTDGEARTGGEEGEVGDGGLDGGRCRPAPSPAPESSAASSTRPSADGVVPPHGLPRRRGPRRQRIRSHLPCRSGAARLSTVGQAFSAEGGEARRRRGEQRLTDDELDAASRALENAAERGSVDTVAQLDTRRAVAPYVAAAGRPALALLVAFPASLGEDHAAAERGAGFFRCAIVDAAEARARDHRRGCIAPPTAWRPSRASHSRPRRRRRRPGLAGVRAARRQQPLLAADERHAGQRRSARTRLHDRLPPGRSAIPGEVQQSYPLAIGGTLFVTTNDANVFAIDGASGRILWQRSRRTAPSSG